MKCKYIIRTITQVDIETEVVINEPDNKLSMQESELAYKVAWDGAEQMLDIFKADNADHKIKTEMKTQDIVEYKEAENE
jgi:hypothetical protein